ncbi:MAG: DUF5654 family protein [Candidatus Gracilibacteria bacterium]
MAKLTEKLKEQSAAVKREVKKQLLTYIIASLGLVAGLAWNEAIKALIEYFFPASQNTLLAKFLYAGGVTMLIVVVSYYLAELIKKDQEKKPE